MIGNQEALDIANKKLKDSYYNSQLKHGWEYGLLGFELSCNECVYNGQEAYHISVVGGIYDAEEYKKNSSSLYWCYKLTETSTTAKTEYYCPDGYTLNGTKCYAYYETDVIYKLTCPSGYTLFGIQCQKN